MKSGELRNELRRATKGLNRGWRRLNNAKELKEGEYAFIRTDNRCRGWRIVLNPVDKRVALQQYNPGVDTEGCDCMVKDEFGFPMPDPDCSKCGGTWEIPVDYQTYTPTRYEVEEERKEFNAVLSDLYFYSIHPLMRGYM